MGKGARQGGAATPELWTVMVADCCEGMLERWRQEECLDWAPGHRDNHMVWWADNVFVFSSCPDRLRRRMCELDTSLAVYKLRLGEGEILRGKWANLEVPELFLPSGIPCKEVEQLRVLGIAFDNVASTRCMQYHREACSDRMWWKHGPVLCQAGVHPDIKLRTLYGGLGACLLHGCPLWTLDKRASEWIRTKESRWLRQCLGFARPHGE